MSSPRNTSKRPMNIHPGMLRRNISVREPGDVYCPERADYVDYKSVCKKCPEFDEDLVIYYNCRLKKKESNKLSA